MPSVPVAALSALLVLSGASALVYQVLWLRVLGLVFGVTVYAATAVLASFMAGLAVGSVWGGRIADRVERPLRALAAVELLVGLTAVLSWPAIDALTPVYVALAPGFGDNLLPLTVLRVVASFVILLVPTTLMGATFPLAAKTVLGRAEPHGDELATLYSANTTGAIAGTLLAAFVFIGSIGVSGTFRLAAGMNLLVALGAWWMARRFPGERAAPADAIPQLAAPAESVSSFGHRAVLAVFAISGFVSLALEIIWFRVLTLLLPATTYAFAVMLATVLFGIAFGSAIAPAVARRVRNTIGVLAILEVLTAAAVAWSARGLARSYQAFEAGERVAGELQNDFAFVPLVLAAAVSFLPAMILMGLAFPLGLRAWTAGSHTDQGARVGQFYSANLGAAILGAVAGGFLILPLLGTRTSLLALAWLTAASGLLLVAALPRERRSVFAIASIALFAGFFWSTRHLPDPVRDVMAQRFTGERPFWHEEGAQTTATVNLRPFGVRVMYVNGLHQANDTTEMVSVHRQMGYLPVALHPAPRRALVIGLGGGATAGAVTQYPGIQVDVVELSGAVVRAAEHFSHVNFDILRNPRVRVRVDDGRSHLLLSGERYDVITADIVQPKHAGAGNVYSAEYFSLAREALDDGGLMLQWIGQREDTQYRLIMRTFLTVFPHATLWAGGTLMVGSKEPLRLSAASLEGRMRDPAIAPIFQALGAGSLGHFAGLYTAGPDALRSFVGDGPILLDDRPSIEYFLSLPDDHLIDLRPLHGDVSEVLTD